MKTIDDIINSILSYNPKADVEPVRKAYAFAEKAHAGQVRHSGEPYLSHPMEVADILTQLKLDVPSIVAGILHDTVEDSSVSLDEIGRQFGETVALLVDGVTNIGKIVFKTKEERQAENFRKMVLSMSKDIRIILIKLADRLHNMRTLQHHTVAKQRWIAQETIDIYAPLANRLGIGWIKAELEDLCLRYLNPEIYFDLVDKVAKRKDERDKYINEVIEIVRKSLAEHGFKADVQGRSKHFHSVYQKMQREGITFDEVYDLTAIRIISDTKFNCYGILGMIHSLWTPVPGKFKDY
ncbi:MAG: bifunctional (p)ppGpp synthetase/guanosine-3',5'-bis(diphosphate) 3'-pyrophosphohydrolase, partial [Nitrospirae bacterium]|nr:bifunctional (p)ppGpp synthetase/guanosine-3',5'-bis(diphosphate) 3'-pyrophosphohydrolase [Nitrospirota bacterium]